MFGGANLGGSFGAALGIKSETKGYEDARWLMQQMGEEAKKASSMADPFQQYRAGLAGTLNDYVTGKKSIQTDPGYQFAYQEGQRGVERASAARGMNNSGNVMAALQQRGQDVASQQYGSIIDRLTNLSGATAQNAIAGGQIYGNMMQASLTGQAEAEIGLGMSQSKQKAAWGDFAHNVALFAGSMFGGGAMGGSNTTNYASQVGGGYSQSPGTISSYDTNTSFDVSRFFR